MPVPVLESLECKLLNCVSLYAQQRDTLGQTSNIHRRDFHKVKPGQHTNSTES